MFSAIAPRLSPAQSLRSRFAWVMGISGMLFGLALTGYFVLQLENTTRTSVQKTLQITSQQIAGRLAEDLEDRERELGLLTELIQSVPLNKAAEIRHLLNKLKQEQPSYAWIGVTDLKGIVKAASDGLLEQKDASARPWFSGGMKGRYLSDPHETVLLAKIIGPSPNGELARFVDIALPLKDANGQLRGVLVAHLHWHWVQQVVATSLVEMHGAAPTEVLIANHNNQLIFKPGHERISTVDQLENQRGRHIVGRAGSRPDGLSAGLGWTVFARQEARDALAVAYETRNIMLLLSLAGGVAFVWLSWVLAGRTIRPLAQLATSAHEFHTESGQAFDSSVAERHDEIGTLARVIRELVRNLQDHAARTQLFIEHAPVPLAILDTRLRYIAVSRRWRADYGLDNRKLIGQSHYDLFPAISEPWRQMYQRALAGEIVSSPLECVSYDDGRTRWLRGEMRPWQSSDGEIGGIVLFTEDISERVRTEQALQDSERRFRATLEQAAVGISHVGLDGHWLSVNKKLCEIVGYSREELLTQTFQDITYADDLDKDLDNVGRLLSGELDQYQMEKRYIRKNGSLVWINLTVALVRNAGGQPGYFVAVVEDIEARKRAEAELLTSRQRFAGIVASAMDGIISSDEQGRIVLFNAAAEKMFGVAAGDALGSPLDRFIPGYSRLASADDNPRINAAEPAGFATGQQGDLQGLRGDGTQFPIEAAISQVQTGSEQLHTIILRDISGRLAAQREIREREALFRSFFEASSVGAAVLDKEGRFVAVNDCYSAMLGYRREELLAGLGPLDLTHPDDLPADSERVKRLLQGEAYDYEKRFVSKQGQIVWVHVSAQVVLDRDGKVESIVGVIQDITHRRQAAEAMRNYQLRLETEVEERTRELTSARNYFRDFIVRAPIPLCVSDADGRIAIRNEKFISLFGYDEKIAPTLDEWWKLAYPDPVYRTWAMESWEAATRQAEREQRAITPIEYRVMCADGRERHVEIAGVTLDTGMLVAFADVSERHHAQLDLETRNEQLKARNEEAEAMHQKLEQQRNLLQGVVDHVPFGVVVYDEQRYLVMHNALFVAIFDYPADVLERPGLRFDDFVRINVARGDHPGQTIEQVLPAFIATMDSRRPVHFERKQNDGRFLSIDGVPLPGGWTMVTYTDISVHKQAEQILEEARQQAEAASRAKSEFLATMSHEIRTPMNAILGTAQILERMPLPDEERRIVGTLRSAGRSLLAIINDVLDLSKIEAGHFELEHSPFVLSNVLSHLVDIYSATATAKGVTLAIAPLPSGVDALLGDAHRLGQVLNNLVSNALKFTTEGEVSVAVTRLNDAPDKVRLRFAITDTGIGIPADVLSDLFQPFTQADASTSRHYGGTGLGLAICRQLVELMGGQIGVNSQPGQGSEFWFEIPFEKALQSQVKAPTELPAISGPRLSGLHLLVVDDSQVNLDLARRLLALEGASCATASDGEEAIALLRERGEAFDLVLMDVQMPGMDGLEATRQIRDTLGLTELPVIALTAGALPSQRDRASMAGMNDFIAKPFELDVLVAAIHRYAGHRVTQAPTGPSTRAVAAGFPAIAGIDSGKAAHRMRGDLALFFSTLRALRSEFSEVVEQLRFDVACGDLQAAARRMHKLRGVAGNASAERVAALAAALEATLNQRSTEGIEDTLKALDLALTEVLSGLPADVNAIAGTGPAADVTPADIDALIQSLSENDMKALTQFDPLRAGLLAAHGESSVRALGEAIDNLDFIAAARVLRSWYPQ